MDHRSADTTAAYYTVTNGRKRKAIESVKRLSFDTRGNFAPVSEDLYSMAAVAVPFGNCTELTNIKAGGKACPVRFQCGGCTFFRYDPSHLPDLKAHLERIKEDLAWQIAQNLRPSLITDTRIEIESFEALARAQETRPADLPPGERESIQEASGVLRRLRADIPTAPPSKISAMLLQRKKDSRTTRQAVLSAIEALERTQTCITVAEVARRARVSPWLVRQDPSWIR